MVKSKIDNIRKTKVSNLSSKNIPTSEYLRDTLVLLVITGGLIFVACSQIVGPSLCQCINEPGYKYYDKNVEHCNKLIKKEFGTKDPSTRRLVNYVNNNCK